MEGTGPLQAIISNYWQPANASEINWETQFNSAQLKNFSSLRMLRFLASVEERFGVNIGEPDAIKCFGDLREVIEGSWAR